MGSGMSSPEMTDLSNKVRFHLYAHPNDVGRYTEIRHWSVDSLRQTTYNTVFPLTILVHGFNNTFQGSFLQDTKNALLRHKVQTNVIMMDYRDFSRIGLINFPAVIPYVPVLSQRLVDFLLFLISTGFDEAEEVRLCPSDAAFVDVVHSNQGRLGYRGSCGMVDFYLNGGGPIQPKYKETRDRGWMGLDRHDLSHAFAVELFTETIQKKVFYGCGCKAGKGTCEAFDLLPQCCASLAVFGYHSPSTTRGEYYVRAYAQP